MFNHRSNAQKPDAELLRCFRTAFSALDESAKTAVSQMKHSIISSHDHGIIEPLYTRMRVDDLQNTDTDLQEFSESWQFSPSMLDPNSFTFLNFANQSPTFSIPSSEAGSAVNHSQIRDLSDSTVKNAITEASSNPFSEPESCARQVTDDPLDDVPVAGVASSKKLSLYPTPLSFYGGDHVQDGASCVFSLRGTYQGRCIDTMAPDVDGHQTPTIVSHKSHTFESYTPQSWSEQKLVEKFRYRVTLEAPTAVRSHAVEETLTYLNKGQTYTLLLSDTEFVQRPIVPGKYYTSICISFADEQQRQDPAATWSLWKDGRGASEAHNRAGKLKAVEFVPPAQYTPIDPSVSSGVELDSEAFDGFSVTWLPTSNAFAECSLRVRFNFLSSDFNKAKGVKGVLVRLCARTMFLNTGSPIPADVSVSETCYCTVKLFREHGAERGKIDDATQLRKAIEKVSQQLEQVQVEGIKQSKRRKKNLMTTSSLRSQKQGKKSMHFRSWPMSSTMSWYDHSVPIKEVLRMRLQSLQHLSTLTSPVSLLHLNDDQLRDSDLPSLRIANILPLSRLETSAVKQQATQNHYRTPMASPSHGLIQSKIYGNPDTRQIFQISPSPKCYVQTATQHSKHQVTHGAQVSSSPARVRRTLPGQYGVPDCWFEAIGVDYTYQPPVTHSRKAQICLFVRRRTPTVQADPYYKAVYIMQQTLKDLVGGVARKYGVKESRILQTFHMSTQGVKRAANDEWVRGLSEGQDMVAEFHEIQTSLNLAPQEKNKPEQTDSAVHGGIQTMEATESSAYELIFFC